jgi:uncharacterized protein Usg
MQTPSLILAGGKLCTAEITYRLPDRPVLLQTFIWQKVDLPPEFPELNKFLQFWRENLDGPLHSVIVKIAGQSRAGDFRPGHIIRLH